MAGFCRIWIPEFGLWAKPLYDYVKGTDHDPFHWSPEADKSFKILKRKLMEAPALGLLDLSKPFQLYIHERKAVALGVLTQLLGTWKRPVAYFSKQLDQVAKGWPACLRAVAATALVLEEAKKLTLGGVMQIYTPHMVGALLATQIQADCLVCQKNNPRPGHPVTPATLEPTPGPGLVWQIDFTEFPRTEEFRYLLVLVDRFSGWPEAFPCRNCAAKTVALKFVREIIPCFGLPQWMESDNGTHFTSKIVQDISDALQIPWKLHTPWRPQASGVVEHTNQTLK
ncbi:unnamed protein product [Natator depressus]